MLFRSLEPWRRLDGELLIALDGTQYHRSQAIHCEHCAKTEHRNGEVSYSHTVVTPVVVAPGRAQVMALAPEFVVPQDGHEKQDCETAAAKRWIATYGEGLQGLHVTLLGDDLYSRQPLCEAVLEAKLKFIFVAKPSSHITLYQWLEGLERAGAVGTHQVKWRRGKKHFTDTYRFASQLPLREGAGGLQVNWFEIHTTDEAGKTLYHNAWVTPHAVHAGNVAQRVEVGRARWKVESVPQAHREEDRKSVV